MLDFDMAYAEHHATLLRYATRRCGDLQLAADIVAETWAKAWKRRETYEPCRSTVGAWLQQICKTSLVDHYRARRVTLPLLVEPPAPMPIERPDWEGALDRLSPHLAQAVRAVYLDGCTYDEAALALGQAASTVHRWAQAGIARLQRIMGVEAA